MTGKHRHIAIPSKTKTVPFSGCVSPDRCVPGSHDNVTVHEYCSCGAVRKTNMNGSFREHGEWKKNG